MRIGKRTELIKPKDARSYSFALYESKKFENMEYMPISDEVTYLEKLLGKNYKENFQFLNYVEQEENIFLLKRDDKERKGQIAHLFNTSDFETQIEKLTEAYKKIRELCGAEARDALAIKKQELKDLRTKLTSGATETPYQRLIKWKKVSWDNEQLEFPHEQYVEWLGADGELTKLEVFLANIDEFQKERENRQLDKLLADEKLINQLLLYWNFISSVDERSKKLELLKLIDNFLKTCGEGILYAIKQGQAALPVQLYPILLDKIDTQAYSKEITSIQALEKNASTLSKLLVGVKDSRKAFIDKFMTYEAAAGAGKVCPLCGYSWQEAKELKQNFDMQAQKLEELIKASGNELNIAVDFFNKRYLAPVMEYLRNYSSNNSVDEVFIDKLKVAAKNRANLENLFQQFKAADIDLGPFLNAQPFMSEQTGLDKLRATINKKIHALIPEKLQSYYAGIFLRIFDESFEKTRSVSKDDLSKKRNYIEWQYSLFQSNTMQKTQNELDNLQVQFDSAKLLKEKMDAIIKIYKASLDQYQASLIRDIEILFHIYSGRITQESQGGLGLFIESNEGRIRFLETHSKKHDAVFTMSSGQLAALIISFTLALNKKYSKHLLLFIDDPIQTLDELNIVGFVEVLRHQFLDRQIFISTHEDMMSAFMRYKFDKFGIKTQRLSFKEKMLSTES